VSYKKKSILALIALLVVFTLPKLLSNDGNNSASSTKKQDSEPSQAVAASTKAKAKNQREFLYVYGTQNKPSSVLVQIDSFSHIELVENQPEWIKVKAKIGLPVWVKSSLLSVNGDMALLKEDTVTHSIPINTEDTLAGELYKGIKSKIIDTRGDWTQILTPNNYTAWVSKKELTNFEPKSGIKSKDFLKSLPGLAQAIEKPKAITKEAIKTESIKKELDQITQSKKEKKSKETLKTSIAEKPKKKIENKVIEKPVVASSTTNSNNTLLTVYNSTNHSQQVLAEFSDIADLEVTAITHKENQKTWVKVSSKQGFTAWAPSKNFKKDGVQYTANSRVFLRTSPQLKRKNLFAKLNKGDAVTVIKKESDWFQIKSTKKFYAWVDSKQLTQFKK